MRQITAIVLVVSATLLVLGAQISAAAGLAISDHFVRTGQEEVLTIQLNQYAGATTTQVWSGLVELEVSGTGIDNVVTLDSFYAFNPASPATPASTPVHGIELLSAGCATSGACSPAGILAFIVFSDGVGFVPTIPSPPGDAVLPGGVVPYVPAHTYRVVVDTGTASRGLTFRYGDGGTFDNSGQFQVRLFGVIPKPSVEPPFSTTAARCQQAIGRAIANLVRQTMEAHSRCLDAQAHGRVCNVAIRSKSIAQAVRAADSALQKACNDETFTQLGFGGTASEVREHLIHHAVEAAESQIREGYPARYPNTP